MKKKATKKTAKKTPVAKAKAAPAPAPTIDEQLSTALSGLTTSLSAHKRAKGEVTTAQEAESAQQTRLAELRVLTETAESDSEGMRDTLTAAIDALRGVLSVLKTSITD